MTRACVSLSLLFFFCASLAAHPVSPHAQQAVEAIRQLRAIGLPADLHSAPPDNVPRLLRLLNQELKALIIEDLNDRNRHAVPSEDEIFEQLTAAGWEQIPNHKWNAYGEIRQITFDWKEGYEPGILVVSTQLWLPCGSVDPDSAIYVFQGIARHWDMVLAADSDFDPAGKDDANGMQHEISPPDSSGHWFLVLAHMPPSPSCEKAPNVLRYQALRPGTNANQPTVLVSGRESINPLFEPAFEIQVDTDWFAITQGRVRKLDGQPGIAISRFDVSGYQLRRLAPLALAPEDFLDQWVQLSWDDVRPWTKASTDSSLEQWHSKLNSLASDSVEIESVHRCSGTKENDPHWLIELSIDQPPNPSINEESLYIQVAKKDGNFLLDGVYRTHPPGCSGRTPPASLVDLTLPFW